MRVDPNLYANVTSAMQQSEQSLQTAMAQLSSGKRVAKPSDDPVAYAAELKSLAASANVDRFTKNATTVSSQAQRADSVLSNVITSLTKAISLGTEAGDGSLTSEQRTSLAQQVQGILTDVVAQANTTSAGVPLFGGTSSTTTPFVPDASAASGYAYTGDNGTNQVQVGDAQTVAANIPGSQIFASAQGNVLGSLQQMVTALQSGAPADIAGASSAVSDAISHLGQIRATYGNVTNQLTSDEDYMSQETVSLASEQNSLVGVDLATAATNLTQAQTAQSAVLAMAAKILPTSLLNYLQN